MTNLSGLSAFPITPADPNGRVDVAGVRKLVGRLVAAKVDSIGLLGSTGTYLFLTREERRRAIDAAIDEVNGRTPLIAGVGALRTDDAIRLAQDAKSAGATAGLLAAVSYTPLNVDEVFTHFATVARESGLPIIIYDNPMATHFSFTPALIKRLSEVDGIVAIKNPGSGRDELVRHLSEQRVTVPSGFAIGYSGDWHCAEAMIAGADSWYSVLGGLLPELCVKIVRAAQAGDAVEARRLNAVLEPLWDMFRTYSGLRTVYAAADILGVCHAEPPRPLLPLAEAAKHQLAVVLAELSDEIGTQAVSR